MFRNYFKTSRRNLTRNKGFAFTNLLNRTIGITTTLLILLWVQDELSWNKFHKISISGHFRRRLVFQ